jgi:hypothetical protein
MLHSVELQVPEKGYPTPIPAVFWIQIRIHFGQQDLDLHLDFGSGSRGAKMTHKREEHSSLSVICSLLRDEDFFCSFDVLYGGLVISELQF